MEILNMTQIEVVFKALAIIQIFLFIVLFVLTIIYKIWKDHQTKKQNKWMKKIQTAFLRFDKITLADRLFLIKQRVLALTVFFQLEKTNVLIDNKMISSIINDIFLPYLSDDVASTNWLSRNQAALLLQLKNKYVKSLSDIEESYLLKLIGDSVSLVSLNAAIAICFAPNQKMLNFLIDIFSQNRRSQYELLTAMMEHAAFQIIPLIESRLIQEKNIFIRVFCYRMLRQLPKIEISNSFIESDLSSDSIDLKLAALSYITYIQTPHFKDSLVEGLQSKDWEVRARAAKLVGYTGDEHLVTFLEPLLKDQVWWVRYRASEALISMGKKGLGILKAQKIKIDQFAFEIAQQQIESYQLKKTIV